jgi:hypothetical protein
MGARKYLRLDAEGLWLATAKRIPASSGNICRHFGYCSPLIRRITSADFL